MELMIAFPLTVPDQPLSLDELEGAIQEWGQEIKRRALAQAWAIQATRAPVTACPACQSCARQRAGHKARLVETIFGPVRLVRQRYRCLVCDRHFQPADALLLPHLGAGRCTPRVRELAATCGASWPYQQAAVVLGKVRGVPLAAETIRRIVAVTGQAVASQQHEEAIIACQPPATAYDVTRFGALVTAAIDHRDGFGAAQTLLGDGAAWIWHLGAAILPDATPVLDRWHLRDARRRATRAAVPDKAERAPWSARIEEALEAGSVDAALVALTQMAQQYPHPALGEFAIYLRNQAARIPDYAARRTAGETIGSGVGEKGVDVVVNRRLKGRRGMCWLRARADGVVALRLAVLNVEWADRMTAARAA